MPTSSLIDARTKQTDYSWVMDGMAVWASAYRSGDLKSQSRLRQTPVRGLATYLKSGPCDYEPGKPYPATSFRARYFVPFRKDSDEPAWSRAVRIESRDVAMTGEDAVRAYNARIREEIRAAKDKLARLAADLLPEP